MDRKEFLRTSCKAGLCACAGMFLMNRGNAAEDRVGSKECSPSKNEWKIEFVQKRYGQFIDVIGENIDATAKSKVIEGFGEVCGRETAGKFTKYVNDIDGFLKDVAGKWAEKVEYDKDSNVINITGKPAKECFCPFVGNSKMSDDYCNCSKGWTNEVYKTILGKNVETEMTETVLRGDGRCSSRIKVLA